MTCSASVLPSKGSGSEPAQPGSALMYFFFCSTTSTSSLCSYGYSKDKVLLYDTVGGVWIFCLLLYISCVSYLGSHTVIVIRRQCLINTLILFLLFGHIVLESQVLQTTSFGQDWLNVNLGQQTTQASFSVCCLTVLHGVLLLCNSLVVGIIVTGH